MQEKILNFDNLLKNVHLKISGNPEAEKILKKIEEKAKAEVFAVCESLSYKTKFPPKPVRKNKKGIETKEEKEAFLNEIKQYEKEKENIKKNAEKVFAMLVHDGMQGMWIDASEKKFLVKLENIVPGNDACVMLKILQELAGVAEASRVLTVEFGEMWDGEFWRVEESWTEWKEFVECVFGLARVEYRFGKNTKGE